MPVNLTRVSITPKIRTLRLGAFLSLYRDVWWQLKGRRCFFVGAVACLVCAQLVLLSVPYISGKALNTLQLQGSKGFQEAGLLMAAIVLVACLSWVFHGPGRILERRGALLIRQRMSEALVERLFQLPLAWHDEQHSGATAHRVQQSTQALSSFAQSQFIYLNSAVRLIGPLVALWWIQPIVGVVAVGGFTLIVCSVVGFDRAMLRLAHQENDAERLYAATLNDTLGNAGTVYALRQASGVAARLHARLLSVFVPLRRAIVLNELKWFTVDLSTRILNCFLVGLFVWLATRAPSNTAAGKALLLGSLYMVWEYSQQAANVICSVASHFQIFARQYADYTSADLIMAEVPVTSELGETLTEADWQRITIRGLVFRHVNARSETSSLESTSFRLERGKRYALIGASGSGKTTLLRVLAGLYTAEHVALTLNSGLTIVSPSETAQLLRARTTLIPQDAEVYEGTLEENLSLCQPVQGKPPSFAYSSALEAACANDFLQTTPMGLKASVAERGANWSGGQRSRVALARGILAAKGSDIVMMDEPTASLDPATEAQVYTNLFAAFGNACLISSVHRMSLLDRFDEILIMNEGRLVAQGTIAELTLTNSEFNRLTRLTPDTSPSMTQQPEHSSTA